MTGSKTYGGTWKDSCLHSFSETVFARKTPTVAVLQIFQGGLCSSLFSERQSQWIFVNPQTVLFFPWFTDSFFPGFLLFQFKKELFQFKASAVQPYNNEGVEIKLSFLLPCKLWLKKKKELATTWFLSETKIWQYRLHMLWEKETKTILEQFYFTLCDSLCERITEPRKPGSKREGKNEGIFLHDAFFCSLIPVPAEWQQLAMEEHWSALICFNSSCLGKGRQLRQPKCCPGVP